MTALPLGAVLLVCRCGRGHDAETWARLTLLASSGRIWAGTRTDVVTRRCDCGETLTMVTQFTTTEAGK
jgi:hypothetical protein